MRRIAVGDIMTRKFVSASPFDSLQKCAKIIARERVNSLLITNKKHLFGILTARDILWTITKSPSVNLKNIKAIDIATRKVAVIKPSADISEALKKMKSLNFRRLPVLSRGELIGIVTLKDILAIEPEIYGEIQELMDLREEKEKLEKRFNVFPETGICDNCGAFSELLKVESQLLCPDCRDELY